ncbi:hypothetical protein JCM9279_007028 [Rhodotorula babjevae]
MSSSDEAPRKLPRPVSLFDQADAAAEIVNHLADDSIKVITSGSVAAQLHVLTLALSHRIELYVASARDRSEAAAALGGPQEHGHPVFELTYDQPQSVDIKVHPAWLKSEGRLVRSTGIKVPVSSPHTILLDLLCSTADSLECRAVEQSYCDLSALYIFSLLVCSTTYDGRSRSPFISMDWAHDAWAEHYDEHLRADRKCAHWYADVRKLLRSLDVDERVSEAGLHKWASWLLRSAARVDQAHVVEQGDGTSSPDARARAVAKAMSMFLREVKALMLPPSDSYSPVDDKRLVFESRYDLWQYVVFQLKPKWLDGTTTVAKTDRIEIRRPAPASLLIYLLYDVVAAVERLTDGPEPLHCALSVLYTFSLLVLPPQQPASDSKHVELKFSHSSWRETFDRHLRGDEAHRERSVPTSPAHVLFLPSRFSSAF